MIHIRLKPRYLNSCILTSENKSAQKYKNDIQIKSENVKKIHTKIVSFETVSQMVLNRKIRVHLGCMASSAIRDYLGNP